MFITICKGTPSRVVANGTCRDQAPSERRRFQMDSSSGMKRGGWTWKRWLGIAIGVAVLVAVILLIAANAGSGSGGIY
ncbi:MAG TPA: hypothetical protein VFM40_01890 [Actinomycetota bacterium]|nr:hypothetical protein [Actinomycetota bacterium]